MKDQRAHQGRRVSHASPFLFVLLQARARGERAVTMVKKVRIVAAVAVALVLDTSGVGKVTEALIDAGFSDQEIRLVMGANVLRVLAETLP